ncbi:NACHT domain-containing protein [Acrocarpospora sp. B8E8]|uniref:NACHT domain-containing protein n=1 Tax=Acrocarpospora sp. B8E8 TaxID=3153572 RepID=UPI00325C9F7F
MSTKSSEVGDIGPSQAFASALQDLHAKAGKPSARRLATEIGTVSHTTVAEALSGRRVPTWPVVASIVRQLGGADVEPIFRRLWAAATNESPAPTEHEREDSAFLGRYLELAAGYYAMLHGLGVSGFYRASMDDIFVPPRLAEGRISPTGSHPTSIDFAEFSNNNIHRTVLLGDPGSGKTTLCHALMRYYAVHDDLPTPFFIPLREFAAEFPPPQSIIGFIERRVEAVLQIRPPRGMVERQIAGSPTLVIFDGLDEVLSPPHRAEVVSIIELFAKENPISRILVTSRVAGYSPSQLDPSTYETFRIEDFDDARVARYVHRWFARDGSHSGEADRRADAFLKETMDLSGLRRNPLLLTFLCELYRRTRSIPRDRPQIYGQLMGLMFQQWDASRGIAWSMQARPLVAPVLGNLALKMLGDDKHEFTDRDFLRTTRKFLESRREFVEADQATHEILDFLQNRAWVLASIGMRDDGQETYRFVHKSFMEYLAAQQLVRISGGPERLAQELLARVSAPQWIATGKLAIQLVDQNFDRGAATAIDWLLSHSETVAPTERSQILHFLSDTSQVTDLPNPLRGRIATAVESTVGDYSDRLAGLDHPDDTSSHLDSARWPISSAVPKGVADGLATVQDLLQQSQSNSELALVAVTWIWATFEASIRGILPPHEGPLASPVEAAGNRKLITPEEAQVLTQALQMRNSIAHGQRPTTIRHASAVEVVRAVHNAISAVFERAREPAR